MRYWDRQGQRKADSRTLGNHRRYLIHKQDKIKVGYARVSSHDQKSDLVTQVKFLTPFCDLVLEDLAPSFD